jgi:hypothetical protein
MMHERPKGRWACGPGLIAAARLAAALLAAAAAGSAADTEAPTARQRLQLDRAQSLLQMRLAVLPADSGVLLLRDPDRLLLRIPARLLFEYDTPVLWQQSPAAQPVAQAQGKVPAEAPGEAPRPLAVPLLATAQLLRKYGALQAQVVAYTDTIGGVAANQSLSDARAQAVYQALTAAGVAPGRLQAHGAGAATMVAGNQTPQGRIENRRVEIEFRPEPAEAP